MSGFNVLGEEGEEGANFLFLERIVAAVSVNAVGGKEGIISTISVLVLLFVKVFLVDGGFIIFIRDAGVAGVVGKIELDRFCAWSCGLANAIFCLKLGLFLPLNGSGEGGACARFENEASGLLRYATGDVGVLFNWSRNICCFTSICASCCESKVVLCIFNVEEVSLKLLFILGGKAGELKGVKY